MKIGTKTLLIGCHQFVLHPVYTYVAWRKLYNEFPSFGETVAIIIHDWGYFGKSNLDGKEGENHPEWAYDFFFSLSVYVPDCLYYEFLHLSQLCLYHSRFYAKKNNVEPSKLCWADKYGTILYGKYLWSFLATISGEYKEYMNDNKYEIYYIRAEKDGKFKWFQNYVEFIKPIIFEKIKKLR